jgi:hypothetical protein
MNAFTDPHDVTANSGQKSTKILGKKSGAYLIELEAETDDIGSRGSSR